MAINATQTDRTVVNPQLSVMNAVMAEAYLLSCLLEDITEGVGEDYIKVVEVWSLRRPLARLGYLYLHTLKLPRTTLRIPLIHRRGTMAKVKDGFY
jgi:hypothetical protein